MDSEIYSSDVPYLTTDQMREVDRAMVEDFKIDLVQMMENAGRNLAHLARSRFLGGDPREKQVTVLAGTGGNGGGALVCARRLSCYGARVTVVLSRRDERFTSVPAHQLDILRRMGLPLLRADEVNTTNVPELIIDGLVGYSLSGQPQGQVADLIRWANGQNAPVLSLDVPSGLDADTGAVYDPTIKAAATMTLALPKLGLREKDVESHVGELYLADISVPPALYSIPSLGLNVNNIFAGSDILRLG